MYYIKCNHCGALNDFQNDYLVFCSKCNKKLDNNYTSWQKTNPTKKKEEYIQLYCISDEELEEKARNKPKKKSKLAYIVGLVIVVSISAGLGGFAVNELLKLYNNKTSVISDDSWTLKSYGNLGLKLESPYILTEMNLPYPDEIKQVIEIAESYGYSSLSDINIIANTIMYKGEIGEVSLEGAANGSINEMKTQAGVSNFKYDQVETSINTIPGYKQFGTFDQEGISINFINVLYTVNKTLYQVIVLYDSKDNNAKNVADRIIASVDIITS